jgi:hypothetical protein
MNELFSVSPDENKTKIIFKLLFDKAQDRSKLIAFVPEKNEENFDRLEVELSKMENT